jgi:hypothetical protein
MSINIRDTGRDIGTALYHGVRTRHVVRVDINSIRAAVIAHLSATGLRLPFNDTEKLVDETLRFFIEECP